MQITSEEGLKRSQGTKNVSAIAAMFDLPKRTHLATRVVIAGREITSRRDLPPLPDAQSREDALLKLKRAKEKRMREKYREKRIAAKKRWDAENKESQRIKRKERYKKESEDAEALRVRSEKSKKYRILNAQKEQARMRTYYLANREKIIAKTKANKERKRNEQKIRQSEIGTGNASPQ